MDNDEESAHITEQVDVVLVLGGYQQDRNASIDLNDPLDLKEDDDEVKEYQDWAVIVGCNFDDEDNKTENVSVDLVEDIEYGSRHFEFEQSACRSLLVE